MISNKPSSIRVAYMMSRFPKLTETFILYEMLAVEQENVDIRIYPLMREHIDVIHEEAQSLIDHAVYTPFISLAILVSNFKFLFTKPITYFRTFFTGVKATIGSFRFLSGIVAFYLKAVHMADLMQRDRIEHIHAHFVSHPAAIAYIIHQFTGIPYSFTAHGSDLHRDQAMLCEKVASAKFGVAISEYNKRMIVDHCGEEHSDKIRVVRCGINLDRFQAGGEKGQDYLDIVCVASLHEVKGQRYLVEACQRLQERNIDFRCRFVGDGPDQEMLENLGRELGIADKVIFHGRLKQLEVLERLQSCDVFVLPSVPSSDGRREGIPVSLMEAMACGVPVVSTQLSGIPELVDDGENGFLTAPGDVESIANGLETLYRDPALRQQFGKSGREKVLNEFELHRNAQRLVALFEED